VSGYLAHSNANTHGAFATSLLTDEVLALAQAAVAGLLGSEDPDLVVFGPNMTTLTFALSRALARTWRAGDEVLVTRLEHDANFTPWVLAARDAGAIVKEAAIRVGDCTLDLSDFASKLNRRTRLVACGCASNAVGTVNPFRQVIELAHAAGAQVFLDAVHFAPHRCMDVERWGCDYLACSAYKFFGPHVGILWGKRERLLGLPAFKVRPAPESLPGRLMTGTQNHEGIAGTLAAIEYLEEIGRGASGTPTPPPGGVPRAGRRAVLDQAYRAIGEAERALARRFLEGVSRLRRIKLYGIADPERLDERVATFAFTHDRRSPGSIAEHLAGRGIFAWSGNFYALPLTEALGLEPDGLVRVGFLHYNTPEEVDRLLAALEELE
jgi:cysteine desulfurase family protein (TIGR01976 family)